MNNYKMWLVVNPTVGLPLFFIGAAGGSVMVHQTVLAHSPWVAQFVAGKKATKTSSIDTTTQPLASTALTGHALKSMTSPEGTTAPKQEMTVTFQDGRTARLVFDDPAPVSVAALGTAK